ncbi:HNH endonuclease [Globicatella sanguinis]
MNTINTEFLNKLLSWIRDDKLVKFYQSKPWRDLRTRRLKHDNFECQLCKAEGKATKADMVHHIEHVRDNPIKALDFDNLLSLCNACHNKEHPEKLIDHIKNKKFTNEERW